MAEKKLEYNVMVSFGNNLFGATVEYAGLLAGVYGAANLFSEGVNTKSVIGTVLGLTGYVGGRMIQHIQRETNSLVLQNEAREVSCLNRELIVNEIKINCNKSESSRLEHEISESEKNNPNQIN